MKLRCIKNKTEWIEYTGNFGKITPGKIYEIDEIGEEAMNEDAHVGSYSTYYIKDDYKKYKYFLKECFIELKEERNKKLEQLLDDNIENK